MVQWKKVGTTALALSLTLGLVTAPVHADSKKDNQGKNEQKNNNGKKNGHYKFFIDEEEAQWAINHIIKMATKGVFIGDEYGYFNPNKAITRAEATVAAVRLMGLEDQAKSLGNVDLNFNDAKEIDRNFRWAENYIYVGLENGLFDASMSSFEPNKPASREWVATILVRALGLTADANAKMNTKLDFKDAKAISASAVGYIAVAVEKGLINGYPDQTFQPNRAITRAEMAKLLDVMDWIYDSELRGVKGSVYSIAGDVLQVKRANGEVVSVRIQSSTYIILNGQMVTKDHIKAGQQVSVVLNENKETLLIDLKGDAPPAVQEWYSGKVSSISLPSGSNYGVLQATVNNQQMSFYLNNKTKVYADGLELKMVDLGIGQNVTFRQKDSVITEIKIEGAVKKVDGVLSQIIKPSKNQVGMLIVSTTQGEVALPLANNVMYVYNNTEISLDNLAIGSLIEATSLDGFVKRVKVTQVNITDYSGSIKSLVMPSATRLGQIEILSGKESRTFYVTANTTVKSGNLTLRLSDLALAQKISAKVENEFLKEIKVEGKVEDFDGKVSAIQYPTDKHSGSITIVNNRRSNTFTFASESSVSFAGKNVDIKNVIVGDTVKLRTFNSKVKVLEITKKNEDVVSDYTGTITKIVLPTTRQAGTLELKISNDNTKTFVFNNTQIKSGGLQLDLTDLAINQKVSVKVEKNVLKEVNIEGVVASNTGKVVLVQAPTNTQARTITIENNGKLNAYVFAIDYSVTLNGKAVDFANIEVGDQVQLSTFNGNVKIVEIKEKNKDAKYDLYTGTLVSIDLQDGDLVSTISIVDQNHAYVTLPLHKDVKIYNKDGKEIVLANLAVAASVEIEVRESLVTKITIK